MNILFLDQFGELGGAQRCLLDLLPAFQGRDWRLRFAISDTGPFSEKLRDLGIQVHVLPDCALSSAHKPIKETLRYLRWYPKTARAVSHLAAAVKPDLMYVNGPRLLPPAALVAKRKRIPVLFHAHNRILQAVALRILGAHLRFVRAQVIACCHFVADSLRPYMSSNSIETVYNGVAEMESWPRRATQQSPTIGVIGRIEPEKGQLDFVRAARLIHRELPTCRFVIIGESLLNQNGDYFRQTIEASRDLPVTFTGWQNNISEALGELDLLVVPSRSYDATPRVIVEAFSAGTPVVAFSSGGIPELIEDNRTGFLVSTRSPEALAFRILELLRTNCQAVCNIVGNARRAWATRFRVESFQERVCEVIAATTTKFQCPQ